MEIQIKQSTIPVWRDLADLTKSIQITMESVVPDTKNDIGRILSVRPEILLKSKDLNMKTAVVGGLLAVNILYIDESGSRVSHFKAEESFRLEYELPTADEFCVLQSRFRLAGLKARVLNPRKLAVDCEIVCELSMSRVEDLWIEQSLPANDAHAVHISEKTESFSPLVSVCEKSFSVNEQLPLPAGQPKAKEIAAVEISYRIGSKENLGNRLLVKGEVDLTVSLEREDEGALLTVPYHLPFSQMIDLGDAEADDAQLWIESTSNWLELMETLDERHMLDLELHALIQVRAQKQAEIRYISDAYSNRMPCECSMETLSVPNRIIEHRQAISVHEKLEVSEKFQELISVYSTILQPDADQRNLALDFLYKDQDGRLAPMRKMLSLRMPDGKPVPPEADVELQEIRHMTEGNELFLTAEAELTIPEQTQHQINRVFALTLDESKAFDTSVFPSLTAVWTETESIWELAKLYHSSPEAIREMNESQDASPVFIPKSK